MRRTVRTVTAFVFLAIVVGCAFAVLYLGTATGLTFGGEGSRILQATKDDPVYAQVGWLRNTAPWPVTIQSITTNATDAAEQPTVVLERTQSGAKVSSASQPTWGASVAHTPFQLDGSAIRFLGFVIHPKKDAVAYFTSITVHFTGPLGLQFISTFTGTRVAAGASNLPGGVLAEDPKVNSASLDSYIAELRNVLTQQNPSAAAVVMGGGATTADGAAFLKKEAGYAPSFSASATPEQKDDRLQKLVFYLTDPVKGALPPISVEWTGYRWTVVRS